MIYIIHQIYMMHLKHKIHMIQKLIDCINLKYDIIIRKYCTHEKKKEGE